MTEARVTEEPRDRETITRGSVVAAGWATAPPTITQPTGLSPAEIAARFVAVGDLEQMVNAAKPPGG